MEIKITINYSGIIEELREELLDEILTLEDIIQIERMDKESFIKITSEIAKKSNIPSDAVFENYLPIVNWFYSDETMNELYLNCSPIDKEDMESFQSYLKIKPYLESRTVKDVLIELKERYDPNFQYVSNK